MMNTDKFEKFTDEELSILHRSLIIAGMNLKALIPEKENIVINLYDGICVEESKRLQKRMDEK